MMALSRFVDVIATKLSADNDSHRTTNSTPPTVRWYQRNTGVVKDERRRWSRHRLLTAIRSLCPSRKCAGWALGILSFLIVPGPEHRLDIKSRTPVEAFISMGNRTVLDYPARPMLDSFARASMER